MGRIQIAYRVIKQNQFTIVAGANKQTVAGMEKQPPPQLPLARGYKFVWRILLISNLALGGLFFTH